VGWERLELRQSRTPEPRNNLTPSRYLTENPKAGLVFSGTDTDLIEAFPAGGIAGMGESDCSIRAIDRAADILPASGAKVVAILQLVGLHPIAKKPDIL
jgi:hypothetical protein